jgi:hypothetical protein
MDVLTLSRLQFAVTSRFHFLFVPLTLGLSILTAWMEWRFVRTGGSGVGRRSAERDDGRPRPTQSQACHFSITGGGSSRATPGNAGTKSRHGCPGL